MLAAKFYELIQRADLALSSSEKTRLASDIALVVHRWIPLPATERGEYLTRAMEKLAQRYARERTYAVGVIEKSRKARSDEQLVADATRYFQRVVARIKKEAIRAGYQKARLSEREVRFEIKSVRQSENDREVLSHFLVSSVPRHLVRKGVLIANRKGPLKIAEVSCEELAEKV
jgi:hypothetical protein